PRGNFHPDMAPHDTYPCGPAGGDAWLALTVRDGAEWETLCRVIGRPDLAADAALATLEGRRQRRHGLRAPIEAWARVHPAKDAAALLQEAGVAAIPCYRVADLLSDRHLRERGFFIEDPAEPGKVAMMALPWRLHPAGTVTYGRAPDLGDHTEDVLTEAGLHL
ncbi:MAG: CoA transferase, partial [Chloroflexi bacterium]|nr:CoA transferase [Chloroflexota bacterium]